MSRSLYAAFALAWCSTTVVGVQVFGLRSVASLYAAAIVAERLARLVAMLSFEALVHSLAKDAALSFIGVFVGSFAASVGEPLFGAMLASACSAVALVRAAAWFAVFGPREK